MDEDVAFAPRGSSCRLLRRRLDRLIRSSQNGFVTTASITEAKNNLSKLIKKVRHGESVLILDRNVPVARLEPLAPGSPEADEAKLIELERRGLLKRGTGKLPKDFWTRPLPKLKGSVVQALLDERNEAPW
jgi:prevent-host-death family protein